MVIAHPDFSKPYSPKYRNSTHKVIAFVDLLVDNKQVIAPIETDSKPNANKQTTTEFMHYLYCPVVYNSAPFIAKIAIEEYSIDGKRKAYNAQRIKMSALPRAHFNTLNKEAKARKIRLQADKITIADLHILVKQFDENFNPPVSSKVVDKDGKPLVVYHQTDADFTVFDTESKGAGQFDDETPDGIFLKPTNDDIGLKGKKQMALYDINIITVIGHGVVPSNSKSRGSHINTNNGKNNISQQSEKSNTHDGKKSVDDSIENEPYSYLSDDRIMQAQPWIKDVKALEKLAKLFSKYMDEQRVAVQETAQERNQGGVRYARNESFSNQIDEVLNNTYDRNNLIYMGNTPIRLQ